MPDRTGTGTPAFETEVPGTYRVIWPTVQEVVAGSGESATFGQLSEAERVSNAFEIVRTIATRFARPTLMPRSNATCLPAIVPLRCRLARSPATDAGWARNSI